MSKSNTFENELLLHIFNNADIALIGDATGLRGSTLAGSLHFALHTADPTDAGTQTSSEISYTSYARVAVARSGAGFTVTGNSVSPAANVDFPQCSGGSGTATHFSVGTASSGAGKILYKGALSPTIAVSSGVIPRIETGTTITED
jgi:hypothetical protein